MYHRQLIFLEIVCLLNLVSLPPVVAANVIGFLEMPMNNSEVGGIGIIKGWACDPSKVEVVIDGGGRMKAAYGSERPDTGPACGDVNNGFELSLNWNLLGEGPHKLQVFSDQVEFGAVTFNVSIKSGALGIHHAPGFPISGDGSIDVTIPPGAEVNRTEASLVSSKASQGTVDTHHYINKIHNIYSNSRALLIGVTKYADKKFGPLPYIENDINQLETTLNSIGFKVVAIKGSLKKSKITEEVNNFVRAALKNERLIIFFSTHGFPDPLDEDTGYIASTDCDTDQLSTCLSLNELKDLWRTANIENSKVHHLLVILDTCSSGLGVSQKSNSFNEIEVALEKGSHLMTAGLKKQNAEQDQDLRMSTFTYFFAKGLSGDADSNKKDGIISLSELYTYVRSSVAEQTESRQTPMLGRLAGNGEMIFLITKKGK